MRRKIPPTTVAALLAAATAIGLAACDSRRKNAREEVFGADGGRGMNERLDQYAEPPPEDGAADQAATDTPGAQAPPTGDEPADAEPANP